MVDAEKKVFLIVLKQANVSQYAGLGQIFQTLTAYQKSPPTSKEPSLPGHPQ